MISLGLVKPMVRSTELLLSTPTSSIIGHDGPTSQNRQGVLASLSIRPSSNSFTRNHFGPSSTKPDAEDSGSKGNSVALISMAATSTHRMSTDVKSLETKLFTLKTKHLKRQLASELRTRMKM